MEKTCNKCGVVLEERNWRRGSAPYKHTIRNSCKHCLKGSMSCALTFKTLEQDNISKANCKKINGLLGYIRFKLRSNWKPKIRDKAFDIQEYRKKSAEILSDTYVLRYIRNGEKGFLTKNVPKEIIELKRSQIKLKRLIKQIENGKTKNTLTEPISA